jgi:hypothetical protein
MRAVAKVVLSVTCVFLLAAAAQASIIYPINDGFEVPDLGSGGGAYGYGPDGQGAGLPGLPSAPPGWTFVGLTGIAAKGSAFGVNNATNGNHNGATSTSGQAAVIQGGNGFFGVSKPSEIYQTISGFGGGTASVTFSIESRGAATNSIDVKLDSQDLGTYMASSSSSFNTITTPTVAVTPGSHTLYFISINPDGQDNTQFIDNVSLTNTVVPEPTSLSLLGIGAAGLVGSAWLRRRQLRMQVA